MQDSSRYSTGISIALCVLITVALSMQGCGGKATTRLETVFYPPLPQNPRIQFLTKYHTSKDVGTKVSGFQKFITGQKEQVDALLKPHSSTYYRGKLYVCDSRRGEVVIMDVLEGKMYSLGEKESFEFGKPLCIAISNDGTKYIADNFKRRVYVFDQSDRFVRTIGSEGQFGPTSVAVYGNKLYVADAVDNEVEVLNRHSGELIATTKGSENAPTNVFRMPVNLTVDHKGNLYVSDLLAGNVQVFDSSLSYLRTIGELGDRLGQFGRPRGVAVDSSGFVFVADASFENVQVFSPDGELVLYFGGPSVQPGGLYLPSGVTIAYSNLDIFSKFVDKRFDMKYALIVTNQYGPNGISIYAFGEGKDSYFDKESESDPTGEPDSKAEGDR
ncbi:MAG: hypothetical protein ACE5FH_06200 [Candidatus Zixiibacteriota bacterium]